MQEDKIIIFLYTSFWAVQFILGWGVKQMLWRAKKQCKYIYVFLILSLGIKLLWVKLHKNK